MSEKGIERKFVGHVLSLRLCIQWRGTEQDSGLKIKRPSSERSLVERHKPFWKQLLDLHLKTQWSSVLTLTQAHGSHRWMWMRVPSRVTLKATEQTTGVSVCCVSLIWINRQTKIIFFWALVYHRFFVREKKRKPVLGRKPLYGAALKPFRALNIKLCHWGVCYLFDSIQLLCFQP